jgi:hypothetical protein
MVLTSVLLISILIIFLDYINILRLFLKFYSALKVFFTSIDLKNIHNIDYEKEIRKNCLNIIRIGFLILLVFSLIIFFVFLVDYFIDGFINFLMTISGIFIVLIQSCILLVLWKNLKKLF